LASAGVLGGGAAVAAGLALSRGQLLGSGFEKLHHLFVWPAFGLSVGLVGWRLLRGERISPRSLRAYLVAMGVACGLMLGAGYWGGELLLHGETQLESSCADATSIAETAAAARGRELFQSNCAHCHGDDARGMDEAPDLTAFRKSDARIAPVVMNGIKGEMPRFDQELTDESVRLLTLYLHSINRAAR
jgi:mono/diheme cytochrome c family protein